MSKKLEPGPCPFCKKDKVGVDTYWDADKRYKTYWVACNGYYCLVSGPHRAKRIDAVRAWNKAGKRK